MISQNYCMSCVVRLLVCHFLIVITNIHPKTSVVNTLSGKTCIILFTLTNKKGNKFVLTHFLIENQ